MAANNKQIENRVKQLIAMGIDYPQAMAIANSEIPTMQPGGNVGPNYLQNLESESYQLDKDYRDLQVQQELEWAQGMDAWNDNTMDEQLTKEFREQRKRLDQQDGLNLNTEELKKLFNPYSGYSMEDALMGMGKFVGGDRSVQNAMGFIKAPLAGARSFMSGQGLAKTEKYSREQYEENQRKGLVDFYGQKGGRVTSDEIHNVTGIRFSEDAANNLFERNTQQESVEHILNKIDLGNYKGRKFFNIHDQKSNIRVIPTKENPQNYQGYKKQVEYLQKLNPGIIFDNNSYKEFNQRQPYGMQQGGGVEILTPQERNYYTTKMDSLTNAAGQHRVNNGMNLSQDELEAYEEYTRFKQEIDSIIQDRVRRALNEQGLPVNEKKGQEYIDRNDLYYDVNSEEEKMFDPKYDNFFQEGGALSLPQRMTGEYMQGVPTNREGQAVVEVEDGEHILQPSGDMTEVKGKKHSQGGEKLTPEQIEEGSIVVSDHLKIGGKNVKYFKEKYDVKVKANDTYATVVDKIKKKVGLDSLNKEQEKLIKEVEKQERVTEDTNTKNLNLQFLSEKINELEQEKLGVEEIVKEALVDVYNVQESEKGAEGQPTQDMQVDPNMIGQMAEQYGIPEEQAMGLVQEYLRGGKIPKMQDAGMFSINPNEKTPDYVMRVTDEIETIYKGWEEQGLKDAEINQRIRYLGNQIANNIPVDVKDRREILTSIGQLVKIQDKGHKGILSDILDYHQISDVSGATNDRYTLEYRYGRSNPYYKGEDSLYWNEDEKLRQEIFDKYTLSEKDLKKRDGERGRAYIDRVTRKISGSLGEIMRGDRYNPSEKEKALGYYVEMLDEKAHGFPIPTNFGPSGEDEQIKKYANIFNEKLKESHKVTGRALYVYDKDIQDKEEHDDSDSQQEEVVEDNTVEPEQVNFTWEELQAAKGVTTEDVENNTNNWWRNRIQGSFANPGWNEEGINTPVNPTSINTTGIHNKTLQNLIEGSTGVQEEDIIEGDITREGKSKTKQKNKKGNNQDFFQFPDQSVSPPDSIVAPLKGEVRLGRADTFRIDPSQALEQNLRNYNAQMSQIGNLPPAQRQSAQAALLAEKNAADNQILSSVAMQNAQIGSETDRYNLQRSDTEEQLALQNALSYEDRMFRTQAAYDANLNAYYDYMRDLNVSRYNDVRNQNMVNSLYENYQVNPDGTISVKPDSERFLELQRFMGQNKTEDKKKK